MFSCSDDVKSYPVGTDFIEDEINITIVDTFSIKAGTFKLDSLVTSGSNRLLLGSLKDAYFGDLNSQTYFQVNNSDFTISSNAVYDSIGLVLNYDTYYYGDTTQVQTYKVHRLLEYFEPEDGDDFYNTSKLEYDETVLGEVSFTPRPNSATDSVYIALDEYLGEEIFNKIRDNEIINTDDFLQYFNGLTVIPDTASGNHVLGFNAQTSEKIDGNSSMRLYYTIKDDDNEDNNYYVDFVISSAAKQFNEIETDLTNTILVGFVDNEEIKLSTETDNLIFTQAGSGITARIEIPAIKNLLEISENATTLSAELTFIPLKGSYNENNPLPETLAVYIVDHKNRIIKELLDVKGDITSATLHKDENEFGANTYYSVDLSGFVEEILLSNTNLNYALMVQYEDSSNNVMMLVQITK